MKIINSRWTELLLILTMMVAIVMIIASTLAYGNVANQRSSEVSELYRGIENIGQKVTAIQQRIINVEVQQSKDESHRTRIEMIANNNSNRLTVLEVELKNLVRRFDDLVFWLRTISFALITQIIGLIFVGLKRLMNGRKDTQ